MFIRHHQERSVIPLRRQLFPSGQLHMPAALTASDVKCLESITRLGKVRGFDRSLAAWSAARDGFVLQCSNKLLVSHLFIS
jgi:hypothetical protein